MTTKEKRASLNVSALGFKSVEEFLAKCFPRAEVEPHLRRQAAVSLGERWGHEALDLLRKRIQSGTKVPSTSPTSAHAFPLDTPVVPVPGTPRRPTATRSHRSRKR